MEADVSPRVITLIDPERAVLKKYLTLREDGSVNPSIFLIDREGTLRFKYIAQHMADRPPKEHLLEAIRMIKK